MKRFVLASCAALVAMMTVTAANAADMARRQAMPTKAPLYVAPYNWTGLYVGINGGGGWGNSTWSAATGSSDANPSGALVGGTLGYNWQMGQLVLGLEGDLDWTDLRGTTSAAPCTTSCETRNDWLGTARGRVGYAFDRYLPYLTGGAAFGDIKAAPAGFAGVTSTKTGWTVGAGLEARIAGPWSAKVEYLYTDLGSTNCATGSCALATNVDFHTSLVRGGLNFHF